MQQILASIISMIQIFTVAAKESYYETTNEKQNICQVIKKEIFIWNEILVFFSQNKCQAIFLPQNS